MFDKNCKKKVVLNLDLNQWPSRQQKREKFLSKALPLSYQSFLLKGAEFTQTDFKTIFILKRWQKPRNIFVTEHLSQLSRIYYLSKSSKFWASVLQCSAGGAEHCNFCGKDRRMVNYFYKCNKSNMYNFSKVLILLLKPGETLQFQNEDGWPMGCTGQAYIRQIGQKTYLMMLGQLSCCLRQYLARYTTPFGNSVICRVSVKTAGSKTLDPAAHCSIKGYVFQIFASFSNLFLQVSKS